MAGQSPQDDSKHPLVHALRLLVGDGPAQTSTLIERSALTRALAKAIFTQPGGSSAPGGNPSSWRARLDEARKAHAMLDGLFGGRRWLHVERWVTDRAPVAVPAEPTSAPTPRPAAAKPGSATKAPSAPTAPSRGGQAYGEAGPKAGPPPSKVVRPRGPGGEPRLFGRYLHARGLITLSQLIAAVVWQRKARPSVGQIAVEKKLITLAQVVEILQRRAPGELFLEAAVRAGLLDKEQRLEVLREQRRLQPRIGSYFIEHGILSRQVVDQMAEEARQDLEGEPEPNEQGSG